MFKKLHVYIVKSFVGPWFIAFIVCVFLLLMQFLWKYIEDLVGKGLEWNVITELLFYASLALVPMAMPLSVLLASVMTFGNFGEKNELFAMKSGGISLYRIMFPLFIFNILISVGAFYFSNSLLPYTNLKMRSLLYSIQQQRPEISVQSGIFTEPVDDFSIKADRRRNSNILENLLIYDHRNTSGNTNVTTAESGEIKITEDKKYLILDLTNGYSYEDVKDEGGTYPHRKLKFEHQTVHVELDGLGLDRDNEDLFKNNFEMINNSQIVKMVDSLRIKLNTREYETSKMLVNYSMFKMRPKRPIPDTILRMSYKIEEIEAKPEKYMDYDNIVLKLKYNIDTIYNNLTKIQKNTVIDVALNFSRSAKNTVENMNDEMHSNLRWIARNEIEWHRKYTLAVACLLFYLIGAPLGAIIRKGGFGLPVIISALLFLFYYILSISFENTVRELVFNVELGMWLSTYILIPFAVFVVFKAANDSVRVSSHFYDVVKNIFKKNKKRVEENIEYNDK